MKKLLFAAVAVFAFSSANAQEESSDGGFSQGDVFISGSVGFGSSKTGDFKSSGFGFSPAVGYFVSDNIAVGLRLNLDSSTEELAGVEDKSSSFGAEVLGRYYFTPASKFSLFGELAVGIGSTKDEPAVGGESKTQTFGVNAAVGVNYFLSSNWSIEAGWAGLGYNTDDNGGDGAEKTSTFGLNVDLTSVNIGLLYKF